MHQGTEITYFVGEFVVLRVIWCRKRVQKNLLLHVLLTCARKIPLDSIFKKFQTPPAKVKRPGLMQK